MKNKKLYKRLHEQITWGFTENLEPIILEGKWGFMNRHKEVIIPCKYDIVHNFQCGVAAVSLNERWGFINKEGKLVIPLMYDFAFEFVDNIAEVSLNGEKININLNNERIR